MNSETYYRALFDVQSSINSISTYAQMSVQKKKLQACFHTRNLPQLKKEARGKRPSTHKRGKETGT